MNRAKCPSAMTGTLTESFGRAQVYFCQEAYWGVASENSELSLPHGYSLVCGAGCACALLISPEAQKNSWS